MFVLDFCSTNELIDARTLLYERVASVIPGDANETHVMILPLEILYNGNTVKKVICVVL